MECGGLPPLSPKRIGQQQNDPGEACLARLGVTLRPLRLCGRPIFLKFFSAPPLCPLCKAFDVDSAFPHESCFCKAANKFIASNGVNLFKSAPRIASTTETSIAAK